MPGLCDYKRRWAAHLSMIPGEKSDDDDQGFWGSTLVLSRVEHPDEKSAEVDFCLQFEIEENEDGLNKTLSFIGVSGQETLYFHRINVLNRYGIKSSVAGLCDKYNLPADAGVRASVMLSAISGVL